MKRRYRANYSGLRFAGGGTGIAGIGGAIIGGGLGQDQANMNQDAKNRAVIVQEATMNLKGEKLAFDKKAHKDVKMDLSKKESAKEAEKKSNIKAMRKHLEDNYGIDTTGMSDSYLHHNGDRLENIKKDQTSRKTPKFLNTSEGIVSVYYDDAGKPVTNLVFKSSPKGKSKESKFDAWTEDKIRIPDNQVSDYDGDIQTYDDKGKGYWVSKDTYSKKENARKKLNDDL